MAPQRGFKPAVLNERGLGDAVERSKERFK